MQRVLEWKGEIEQYKTAFKNLRIEKPDKCQHCGCGKFHKWGTYERHVIGLDMEHRISIRRVCCVKCGKTYSYLPSFCVSGVCYGLDCIMKFLSALILKTRFELEERKRRAYAFLKRFAGIENLCLVYLRARGFGELPEVKLERNVKIFTALLEIHENYCLSMRFFKETGRHFMSAK